jgi:ferric-dicitrate binding protein FerR (iron transport regulator)
MNETQLWISAYLDDELTDDERNQLAKALEADPEMLDQLVCDGFIHSQLLDWLHQGKPHETVSEATDHLGHGGMVSRAIQVPSMETSPKRSRRWSFAALAATALIAASISLIAYRFAARPEVVAHLTQSTGSRWDGSPAQIGVGSPLQEGQELNLLQGSALVTFSSGAQILLEAPAALRLDSPMKVHLHNGRMAARVPTTARDFTVTTSLARFVDLGTAFTLSLASDKSFQLHVFEGLVELQLDKRFGEAVNQPLRVAEVHAVTFDIDSGDVAKLEFEAGKLMPF